MKTYPNFKKYFRLGFFYLNIFLQLYLKLAFKIKCYCRKTAFHFKGYTTVVVEQQLARPKLGTIHFIMYMLEANHIKEFMG